MNNLERYFDSKYNIESRKDYCIATLLDPRYKSVGFRSKDNAGIAKELLIQEVITDRQSNNSSPQTLNVSDRSIASETPSADPWDAILVDTEDSEEDTILPIRKQVSEYLKEKRIHLKSDPLSDYWAMKKDRFDIISPLVSKYLSAPPASTSAGGAVSGIFTSAGGAICGIFTPAGGAVSGIFTPAGGAVSGIFTSAGGAVSGISLQPGEQ